MKHYTRFIAFNIKNEENRPAHVKAHVKASSKGPMLASVEAYAKANFETCVEAYAKNLRLKV